jgi:hypothetical protein
MRIASIALLSAAVATIAPAQAPVAPTPVPRTDFIASMDAEFRKMDADKNNIVTRAEAEGFLKATSILAAQQRNVALFQQLDADRNGQVSPAEFAKLVVPAPPVDAGPMFAQSDFNKDQQISLIEYRTGKLVNFDRMDADKDGIVSVAEMKAAGLIK